MKKKVESGGSEVICHQALGQEIHHLDATIRRFDRVWPVLEFIQRKMKAFRDDPLALIGKAIGVTSLWIIASTIVGFMTRLFLLGAVALAHDGLGLTWIDAILPLVALTSGPLDHASACFLTGSFVLGSYFSLAFVFRRIEDRIDTYYWEHHRLRRRLDSLLLEQKEESCDDRE